MAATLSRRGYGTVRTSIVMAAALRFDTRKFGFKAVTGRVDDLLAPLSVVPLDAVADRTYAWDPPLARASGYAYRPNDPSIAPPALRSDLTLVTDNKDEFARVAGLQVKNWPQGSDSEPT